MLDVQRCLRHDRRPGEGRSTRCSPSCSRVHRGQERPTGVKLGRQPEAVSRRRASTARVMKCQSTKVEPRTRGAAEDRSRCPICVWADYSTVGVVVSVDVADAAHRQERLARRRSPTRPTRRRARSATDVAGRGRDARPAHDTRRGARPIDRAPLPWRARVLRRSTPLFCSPVPPIRGVARDQGRVDVGVDDVRGDDDAGHVLAGRAPRTSPTCRTSSMMARRPRAPVCAGSPGRRWPPAPRARTPAPRRRVRTAAGTA